MVNIDGTGNRVAAICFGPKNVIVICGMNKVAKDVDAAVKRIRGYAAPVSYTHLDVYKRQTFSFLACVCFSHIRHKK